MQRQLAKYQIGLAIIGVFSLGIFITVLVQAGTAKQDNNTYNKATKIAEKLNNYTDKHSSIPVSLDAAGINDVPDTISYKRLSSSSYQFCEMYKATSSNFSASDIETELLYGSYDDSSYGGGSDDQPNDYLSIDSSHKKGDNCQTIKPYFYNDYNYDSPDSVDTTPYFTN